MIETESDGKKKKKRDKKEKLFFREEENFKKIKEFHILLTLLFKKSDMVFYL